MASLFLARSGRVPEKNVLSRLRAPAFFYWYTTLSYIVPSQAHLRAPSTRKMAGGGGAISATTSAAGPAAASETGSDGAVTQAPRVGARLQLAAATALMPPPAPRPQRKQVVLDEDEWWDTLKPLHLKPQTLDPIPLNPKP